MPILTATLAAKNRWSKNSPSAVHSKERRRRTCPGRKITAARRRWRGGILPRSWFHNPDGREMYLTEKFSDVLPAEEGEAGHVQACCYQSWFRQIVQIHLHQWILFCRHCLSHRRCASTDGTLRVLKNWQCVTISLTNDLVGVSCISIHHCSPAMGNIGKMGWVAKVKLNLRTNNFSEKTMWKPAQVEPNQNGTWGASQTGRRDNR